MEVVSTPKRQGLVGDHFTNIEIIKKLPGNAAIGHNDILQLVKHHLEIFSHFLQICITVD